MKLASVVIFAVGLLLGAFQIRTEVVAEYRLENGYTQFWGLADKSSTIQAKQRYITQFVEALKAGQARGEFATHDAVWLKTPNNSFSANLTALESLSQRLTEIQALNPNSFEYNTAIQQITAQEQGEAKAMMDVFTGCYERENFPIVWGWIGGLCAVLAIALVIVGLAMAGVAWDYM